MTLHIALIGAGQLGSRYLQGLAKSPRPLHIQVFEPSEGARAIAAERFSAIDGSQLKTLEFVDRFDQLLPTPDLLIVATNSNVRHGICMEVLPLLRPRFTVLEKVLFQQLSHYAEVAQLIETLGLKVWVNHPTRTWPFYRDLKEQVTGATFMHLHVAGGDWGLGCNSLHNLDTLSYLSGGTALQLSTDSLDPAPHPAKRPGFYEFFGLLSGHLGTASFSLYCGPTAAPMTMVLTTDKVCFRIDPTHGRFERAQPDSWQWESSQQTIARFQSDATADLLESLIETGQCALPTYQEADTLHRPFISALCDHMDRHGFASNGVCPIT